MGSDSAYEPVTPGLFATIRHWAPIVTFCPVNKLPDLIWVSLSFADPVPELYGVRKLLKRHFMWKTMFMEDVAREALALWPDAQQVEVRLAFNRHHVVIIP
jgi:hypothetical protein